MSGSLHILNDRFEYSLVSTNISKLGCFISWLETCHRFINGQANWAASVFQLLEVYFLSNK